MDGECIHPIDYRYGSNEMRKIFSREHRLKLLKDVEYNLLKALIDAEVIKDHIDLDKVKKAFEETSLEDVKRWENKIHHEMMAIVKAISEKAGSEGKYIHLGATSNDILDTAMSLQLKEAISIISSKLKKLINILIKRAWEERRTPILGRTHGRAALVTTLGFKLCLYIDELCRIYEVLNLLRDIFITGKLGGAVGSQVELYPKGYEVESKFLEYLKLPKARFYTQVIPRDRLALLISLLAILSSVLEHYANEIRILQRSEIEELFEPFTREQVGSSVMPHKKNPVKCERICGLARIIRGYVIGVLENIVMEHERDLRNSSFERCIIPEIMLIIDEQLELAIKITEGLVIDQERMLENIRRQEPFIYSDLLLQYATINGADRQKVHEILRSIFLSCKGRNDCLKAISCNEYLSKYLREEDLKRAMNLSTYVNAAERKVKEFMDSIKHLDFEFPSVSSQQV